MSSSSEKITTPPILPVHNDDADTLLVRGVTTEERHPLAIMANCGFILLFELLFVVVSDYLWPLLVGCEALHG